MPQTSPSEENKSDDIYTGLQQYVENLKRQSNERQTGDTKADDPDCSAESCVAFPKNFDEVVQCMTRGDLRLGCEKDNDVQSWHSQLLSERMDKVGLYKEYEGELKDDNDLDSTMQVQRSLAKIAHLDRILQRKEDAQWEKKMTAEGKLDVLRQEVEEQSVQYQKKYGSLPSGHSIGETESFARSDEDVSACSSTVTSYKNNSRFFVTDTRRSLTPASSVVSDNGSVDCANSSSATTVSLGRNRKIAKTSHNSSLTEEEEARVSLLLRSEEDEEEDWKDFEDTTREDGGLSMEDALSSMNQYGGAETAEEMKRIDERLGELGILGQLDAEEKEEESSSALLESCSNIICEKAGANETRKRERMIDKALKRLAEAELPIVLRSGLDLMSRRLDNGDVLTQPLYQDDIRRVIQEAQDDIAVDGVPLASKEELDSLILSMTTCLKKQAAFRVSKSRQGRAEEMIVGATTVVH